MSLWRRLVGDQPISTRLVLAVAATMAVVLLLTGAFVFWRVQYALDRQLNQDLEAYGEVVERVVARGDDAPVDTPGLTFQVYDDAGRVTGGTATNRLIDPGTVADVPADGVLHRDVGRLLPASDRPYRVVATRVRTGRGEAVVAAAISRRKHDEALRELLLQLALADLATLVAACLVGYATVRAALNPVERYRRAAEHGDEPARLPVSTSRDDEITRLGHTFNALLDRIRAANERERQFLADAAHELRSPLALMRTELEVALLRPRSAGENEEAFESLRGQVERLITLSNTLLDLEEVRATQELVHEPVRVDLLVGSVADWYADEAFRHGRRIVTHVTPGVTVDANRHWLELALGNLVSNAVRHGRGTITIGATTQAGRILLEVADEGPGFPADFVDRAFDRFARADASRSTRGTGLGLALVLAVAQAHGGTAEIGDGRVIVCLPRHRPSTP